MSSDSIGIGHKDRNARPVSAESVHGLPNKWKSSFKFYPLSLFIIILWIIFVIAMVIIHELAVASANQLVHKPFWYDTLPGICSTIFSQAHLPITAFYLARLSVSALHHPNTWPRSWTELFWIADRDWSGPVGMGAVVISLLKSRGSSKVSTTFLKLCFISIISTITPVVLNRAYVLSTVTVDQTVRFSPTTASPQLMAAVDPSDQLVSGGGAWSTGRTVQSLFNASTFTPSEANRIEPSMFFAGDIQGRDVRLPGILHFGSCGIIRDDTTNKSISPSESYKDFKHRCKAAKYTHYTMTTDDGSEGAWAERVVKTSATQWNITGLRFQGCANVSDNSAGWFGHIAARSGILWVSSRPRALGTISCNSTLVYGNATLDGTSLTFSDFRPGHLNLSTVYDRVMIHPLYAAMLALHPGHPLELNKSISTASFAESNSLFTKLGFLPIGTVDDPSPDLQTVANSIWNGINHMANAIVLISTADNATYDAVEHITTTGYVRRTPFALVAWLLMTTWVTLLFIATVKMFEPTFTGSLNSYAIARLLLEKSSFAEGVRSCSRDDVDPNRLLQRVFTGLADPKSVKELSHNGICEDKTASFFPIEDMPDSSKLTQSAPGMYKDHESMEK